MAFGETFRRRPEISEEEVFEMTGRARAVLELKPSNFEGPVAHWANDRMHLLGETIIPRVVYIEQPPNKRPHRVAWVYHEGSNENGESFCMHHVACDCSGDIDRVQTDAEKAEIIKSCPGLIPTIDKQADLINATYSIDEVMKGLPYYGNIPMEEQTPKVQNFIAQTIIYLLEHDYRHPEAWLANVESGWSLVNLMARIIQITPEEVQCIAALLEDEGLIETDGNAISLNQRLKDKIDAEKTLREVSEQIEKDMAA